MRALFLEPEFLLLDEPLGALDPRIRWRLQRLLKSLFERLGTTVVLVTHDLAEADWFTDDIALLNEGRVRHRGPLAEIARDREDDFVRAFVDSHEHLSFRRPEVTDDAVGPRPCGDVASTLASSSSADETVVVGSKNFTEGVVVGDLATLVLQSDGIAATHRRSPGGTRVLFEALRNGQIDAYGDYTDASQELVLGPRPRCPLREALAPLGLGITDSLGFNDTYAIAVRRDLAEERASAPSPTCAAIPTWFSASATSSSVVPTVGPACRRLPMPQTDLRGSSTSRGRRGGRLDRATDVYTTEAKIDPERMVLLEDDLDFFPVPVNVVHGWTSPIGCRGRSVAGEVEGRFDDRRCRA